MAHRPRRVRHPHDGSRRRDVTWRSATTWVASRAVRTAPLAPANSRLPDARLDQW